VAGRRAEEILPVPYSHVVLTLPHELVPLALQNPRAVYRILFRAESLSGDGRQSQTSGSQSGLPGSHVDLTSGAQDIKRVKEFASSSAPAEYLDWYARYNAEWLP
jgi:hypothetical protein